MMKYIPILLFICLAAACQREKKTTADEPKHPQTYLPEELDSLYKFEDKFSFVLEEWLEDFREVAGRKFTDEQRKSHNIIIHEYTWEVNKDRLLTVWYYYKGDTLKVIHHFEYSKTMVW